MSEVEKNCKIEKCKRVYRAKGTFFTNKFFLIVAGIGMLVAVAVPIQPIRADSGADNTKTVVATTEHGWLHTGTIRKPKEQLLINAYLSERDTNKVVFHTQTAVAQYKLQLWLSSGVKYEKLVYENATIAVDGNVTTVRHDANPEECCTNEKSGPGLTFLTVSATTNEDDRTPPREVRPYKITLHLIGLKAISRAGQTVDLGNYDIVYPLQFLFFHNLGSFPGNSVARLKRCGDELTCGGGPGRDTHFFHRKSTGAEQVEGPTPILESEDVGTIRIPAGEDSFEIPSFDFPYHFPADFFGPGSEPFEGTINCQGDTTIRREGDVMLPPPPSAATIPIELIELHLTSCQPIVVNYGDGSQQQLGTQIIADLQQADVQRFGQLMIKRTDEDGGTFDSFVDVWVDVILAPTFGEILDPIRLDPILTDPIDGEPGLIDTPVGTNVSIKLVMKAGGAWEVCLGTNSDFCPEVMNLDMESEISDAIEDIENEIETQLPVWVAGHGGLDQAFRWADQNGDGKLDEDEVTRALKDANVEIPWWISWGTVSKHLIETYDTDGDGQLNLAELNGILK